MKKKHKRIYDRTVLVNNDREQRSLLRAAGYRLPADDNVVTHLEVWPDGTARPSDRENYYPYVMLHELREAVTVGGTTTAPVRVRGWEVKRHPAGAQIGCTLFRLEDALAALAASDANVRRSKAARREAKVVVRPVGVSAQWPVTVTHCGGIRVEGSGRTFCGGIRVEGSGRTFHTVPRQEVVRVARILREDPWQRTT